MNRSVAARRSRQATPFLAQLANSQRRRVHCPPPQNNATRVCEADGRWGERTIARRQQEDRSGSPDKSRASGTDHWGMSRGASWLISSHGFCSPLRPHRLEPGDTQRRRMVKCSRRSVFRSSRRYTRKSRGTFSKRERHRGGGPLLESLRRSASPPRKWNSGEASDMPSACGARTKRSRGAPGGRGGAQEENHAEATTPPSRSGVDRRARKWRSSLL